MFDFKSPIVDPNGDDLVCEITPLKWISMTDCMMVAMGLDEGEYPVSVKVCDIYNFCMVKSITLVVESINVKPLVKGRIPDFTVYTNR